VKPLDRKVDNKPETKDQHAQGHESPVYCATTHGKVIFGTVRSLVRDHPANPAARLGNIGVPSRENVNMRVVDGLPSREAFVKTDIETIAMTIT